MVSAAVAWNLIPGTNQPFGFVQSDPANVNLECSSGRFSLLIQSLMDRFFMLGIFHPNGDRIRTQTGWC